MSIVYTGRSNFIYVTFIHTVTCFHRYKLQKLNKNSPMTLGIFDCSKQGEEKKKNESIIFSINTLDKTYMKQRKILSIASYLLRLSYFPIFFLNSFTKLLNSGFWLQIIQTFFVLKRWTEQTSLMLSLYFSAVLKKRELLLFHTMALLRLSFCIVYLIDQQVRKMFTAHNNCNALHFVCMLHNECWVGKRHKRRKKTKRIWLSILSCVFVYWPMANNIVHQWRKL